jgi:hypothetical protein
VTSSSRRIPCCIRNGLTFIETQLGLTVGCHRNTKEVVGRRLRRWTQIHGNEKLEPPLAPNQCSRPSTSHDEPPVICVHLSNLRPRHAQFSVPLLQFQFICMIPSQSILDEPPSKTLRNSADV